MPRVHMQRESKNLQVVAAQSELPLVRPMKPAPVANEVVRSCKDMLAAFNLAVNVSGLEEKEIYVALDIDPSHWSRMRKGESHFPLNKIEELCALLRNDILLDYFAWKRGMGTHMLETEAQRQLREEREAHAETAKRLAYLEGLHRGTR